MHRQNHIKSVSTVSSLRRWRQTNRGYDWEEQEILISITHNDGYSGLLGCDSASLVAHVSKVPRVTTWKCRISLALESTLDDDGITVLQKLGEPLSQRQSARADKTLKSHSLRSADPTSQFLSLHRSHTLSSTSPLHSQLVTPVFRGLKRLIGEATCHIHTVEYTATSNSRLCGCSYFVTHKTKFTFLSINIQGGGEPTDTFQMVIHNIWK